MKDTGRGRLEIIRITEPSERQSSQRNTWCLLVKDHDMIGHGEQRNWRNSSDRIVRYGQVGMIRKRL